VTRAAPKIALSASRDIPFDKLVLSQSNVRRINAGVSIEELADDIQRRTLLQSLTVRPVLDADGAETGMFEVPAGGRRYRALELLVSRKRLARTAPIPCVVRHGGIAEEDSLAENVQRAPLHPLDQFRAFLALREKGQSEEEIAAAFFVSVAVVKQRLRLTSVSPRLLDAYAEDRLNLDQLMAFTVNGDHERQEQVFDGLGTAYGREAWAIRRALTVGSVRASDKRAQFIGDAYEAAGGAVMRDLFEGDDGGWLQDVGLVQRLVAEKLEREADAIRAEGWKWVEVAPDFPYGHVFGLRQILGETVPITPEEEAASEALVAEEIALEDKWAMQAEIPEEVDRRFAEIETARAALAARPVRFDPADIARAGVFLSIDSGGALRIERGYVRPEDELPEAPEPAAPVETASPPAIAHQAAPDATVSVSPAHPSPEPEEDEGLRPIPDRVVSELTTFRTLALREALGSDWDTAFLAALHVLCVKLFYRYVQDSCLEIELKSIVLASLAPDLADSPVARSLEIRHRTWSASLPEAPEDLWDVLARFDSDTRQGLFAHCVAMSVNAVAEPWNRRPRAMALADRLARAVDLDPAAAGWKPTVDNFLGRVTKARILGAVREARGEAAAERLETLRKTEMAERAQALLAGSGWLPEPLRTPGRPCRGGPTTAEPEPDVEGETAADPAVAQSAEDGGEPAMAADEPSAEDDPAPRAFAAE
jgi:ParB family chromosome partitioning protein